MADTVDPITRSRMMASVRSRDTGPEVAIRKALHRRGFRYRTNDPKLPGRPDIVFPKYRAAVLIHGCFWHGHDCSLFRLPATRREFWAKKLQQNRERDEKVRLALSETGWRCLTVWECALRGPEKRDFIALIEEVIRWVTTGKTAYELRGGAPFGRKGAA
ncbi:MAG: DNA mismatch endonuclease Vsr [Rhodospirillaceae bacterium]|nr:DNA mismatch endonuclease Vsr [Rhodospirillaceae bacterium]MDE0617902.1 DNA mismatch endonuclease Vsr [Rhodospirillaceae bacterium]